VEKLVLDKLQEIYDAPFDEYESFITVPAPKIAVDYDNEISKVKAQLTRAKKAYLAEIDSIEEYKESKSRLTAQLELLEEKKNAASGPVKINQKQLQNKIMNALTVLRSDAPLEEKQAVSDALIDRVIIDTASRTLEVHFFA
jgi:predicted  nucleic acid-binding Zn-ribbon protein